MGEDGRRRRWGLAGAAVVVVALLGAGLALGDGGDGDNGDDGDGRKGAQPSVTSTTRRPTTTSTAPPATAPAGPQVERPTGAKLFVVDQRGRQLYVDLDTGSRTALDRVPGITGDGFQVVGVRGGVVGISGSPSMATYASLPTGPVVDLGEATQVYAADGGDAVWLVAENLPVGDFDEADQRPPTARLVDLTGRQLSPDVVLDQGFAAGATTDGLVFGAGGRIYIVGADGAVRQVGVGEVLGASGGYVVARTCDARARCRRDLLDVRSGDARELTFGLQTSNFGIDVAVSDAGEMAIVEYGLNELILRLGTVDEEVGRIESSYFAGGRLQWLPNGQGVIVVDGSSSRVLRIHVVDGAVMSEPIAVLAEDRAQLAVVIPG